jgi:hypothetical protein
MTQADSPNTTTPSRITFKSLDAVPPPRARPIPTARELASEITAAHTHLIERLKAVPPNQINPFLQADENDLQLRADHLRIVLQATADYVGAFMRDTYGYSHAMQFDRKYLDGIFDDIIGDTVGAIEQAVARLQDERASRAA